MIKSVLILATILLLATAVVSSDKKVQEGRQAIK
jgi:hypothetical protein